MIDTMDYGEWKFGNRAQGVISCTNGIASKVGTAVGTGLLGAFMGMAGYDGLLEVQPTSAMNMIMALTTFVPAALCIIMAILAKCYDLDAKLPQIREELKERNRVQ